METTMARVDNQFTLAMRITGVILIMALAVVVTGCDQARPVLTASQWKIKSDRCKEQGLSPVNELSISREIIDVRCTAPEGGIGYLLPDSEAPLDEFKSSR